MTLPFGLVEAVSAGEDEIGEIEQFALERYEIGRRKPKIREFVHAVVGMQPSDGARRGASSAYNTSE
jgi:hypothetical protein